MAKLPEYPQKLVTTEAPKSGVSGRTLLQPYQKLFQAIGDIGETIETAGLPAQMEAGAKAVEQTPDGQVKVSFRTELSRSDAAYNRGAEAGYLATLRPAVANDMAKAAAGHASNPKGFQTWAENYEQQMLADKGGAEYVLIQQTVRDQAAQGLRGLTSASLERAEKVNADKITAGLKFRANRLSSIAYQDGLDAPEAQQLLAEYSDLADEQARNPRLAKSPESVRFEVEQFRAGLVIDSARGFVARKYTDDPAEAERYAARVMADPNLNLSADERLKGQREIVTELENQSAGRRLLIDELKSTEVQPLIDLLGSTANVNAAEVTRVRQKAAELGDWSSIRRIDHARQVRDLAGPQLRGSAAAPGGGASITDRIIGVESGGDRNARPVDPKTGERRSSALGAGQFIESTWLDTIRKHRPDIAAGKSETQLLALRTDPALSREMVERHTEDNAGSLVAAGQAPTPGNVYLAHFAGAEGAIKVLSAAPGTPVRAILGAKAVEANPFLVGMTASTLRGWADRKMGGDGGAGGGGGAVAPSQPGGGTAETFPTGTSLLAQKALFDRAKAELPGAIEDARNAVEKSFGFDEAAGDLLVRQALILNDSKRTREVETVLLGNAMKQAEGRTTNRMTTAQAQSLILRLRQPGATGDAAAQLELREMTEKIDARRRKLLDEDPVALGVERRLFPPPAALDWASQDGGAGALRQRGQAAKVLADAEGSPPLSALSKAEIEDFERIYRAAPIEQKTKMMASVATSLDGDVRMETLTRIAGKPGTSGLAWAGALYERNPSVAQGIVRGEEIMKLDEGKAFGWGSDATDRATIDAVMPWFPPSAARARSEVEQAVKARYADLAFAAGDRSQVLDEKRFSQALDEVTGGIVEHNGKRIIAPQPGMKQAGFDGLLWSLRRSDALQGAFFGDGTAVTATDVQKHAVLMPAGDGRYLLNFGTDERPRLAMQGSVWDDSDGAVVTGDRPFVLDLRAGASAIADRAATAAGRREYGNSLRELQERTIRELQERRR